MVKSERVDKPRGFFGEGASRTSVTTKQARQKEEKADAAAGRAWRSTVLVRRRGEVTLPTSLKLEYEGGTTQTIALVEGERGGVEGTALFAGAPVGEPWQGRFKRLELTSARRLVSATVDPEDRLALDVNRLNNARRAEPDSRAAARWGVRCVFWLQQLVALAGL
jgi:hypothetical protein